MRKKRNYAAVALLVLVISALTGCGAAEEGRQAAEDDRLKIVCTIFPEYDWTAELLGERLDDAELTLLMQDGSDLHSYQPTVADMRKISDADLFIYVGGESDFWVEDVLKDAMNPDLKAVNLLEELEAVLKEEEDVEGMQEIRGHDHDHDHEEESREHGEEAEYDEHIWLSLRNAELACGAIGDALTEIDPSHAEIYRENLEQYTEKLKALDEKYSEMVDSAPHRTLIFGDRFPFRYLTEDYGLDYYAAFSGCSAETEASFGTITFLAGKVDELGLPAVLAIDGGDGKIARTIAGNTKSRDQQVLTLNSMQSVKGRDVKEGTHYLSLMEENLEILRQALGTGGAE